MGCPRGHRVAVNMPAIRVTVRLYKHNYRQSQEDINLDPKSDEALRAQLERMVKAKEKTLDLDLSKYRIMVHSLGGGRVLARCRVSDAGATVVKR